MVVPAEGARARTALTAGFSVSSSSLVVSFKRPGRCAGTVGISATPAGVPVWRPVPFVGAGTNSAAFAGVPVWRPVPFVGAGTNSAAFAGVPVWRPVPFVDAGTSSAALAINSAALASTPVVVIPVIKRPTTGVIPVVIVNYDSVTPIGSPMMPAPSISSVVADSVSDSERKVRVAVPNSGILVPSRPCLYRSSVSQPRIIRGDVNDFGASWLDDDRRVLRRYGLLRRGLKITGFLRPLAHLLYGIHHILLLVVVSVGARRRPREVLVHISEDGWKCSERLDARVPGLLIHSLRQSVALHIRMRLHPSVGLDDLLGKRGRRQDLRHKRIRIQRNRRYQLLQILRSLLRVLRRLRALRRGLRVLIARQVLRPSGWVPGARSPGRGRKECRNK